MNHSEGGKKDQKKINKAFNSSRTTLSNPIYMLFKYMKENKGREEQQKKIERNNDQAFSKFDEIHTQAHTEKNKILKATRGK